ncbi:hypothetical protein C8F01DRAFT_1250893 [Mycena amicta]|nr:hypothetical protein C8F01DRAFT_1250893 [Mycena amicta]
MAHGLGGIPLQKANRLRILAKDIAAGRYFKPNINGPAKMFSRCYICRRQREYDINPDSPPLCEICRTFNAARRADIAVPNIFEGKSAVVTGGRINLGFSVALALLRGGASVIATTRFPEDALTRYTLEADYEAWSPRLHILQADFTSPASIQCAIEGIHKLCNGRLDILINNAALTVPIPDHEYQRLIAKEDKLVAADHHALSIIDNALVTTNHSGNAWESRYCDFTYRELLDVLAINAVCPFILIRECVRLMLHDADTHIVNVSSREGMFEVEANRRTATHVHTNMAKAALNMCTQTLAEEFRGQKVYINSVDPGYLSHQHSLAHNGKDGVKEWDVPLQWPDGAARVLNPIIRKPPITGAFFKDFTQRNWTNGWI